jgi:MFS transporter, DHA1 family, inner membrane transport protein
VGALDLTSQQSTSATTNQAPHSGNAAASVSVNAATITSSIAALTAANFIVGLSVLLVPGMLTSLALAFDVTVPVAGQLITAASIVMGLGAPLAAAFTSHIDRRKLLVAATALFVIGHLLCAFLSNFTALMIVRSITVLSAAIITPQAAATIGLLVPPERRGAAIASIFVGWSLASVLAMPATNLIAVQFGWRAPFFIASALSLLVLIWIARAVPKGLVVPKLSVQAWIGVAKHPVLIPVLAVTLISFAGQFSLFSFTVPMLEKAFALSPWLVAAFLTFYGIAGVAGNSLAVRWIPKLGANRFVTLCLITIAVSLLLWSLAFYTLNLGGLLFGFAPLFMVPLSFALLVWGVAGFACNSAQQGRLMAADPALASASMALNTSCLYIGQAIGTPIGAFLIVHYGYAALPWVALVFMLLAIGTSIFATSRVNKTRVTTTT